MSNAVQQTEDHITRKDVPIGDLVPNDNNPNTMSDRQFDLLVSNLQKIGFVDPILVRPLEGDKYRIIGGHHRYLAAKFLDFENVPCTIYDDPDFTDEEEMFQLTRMNVIGGAMDPEKFMKLYEKVSGKYADDVLQDMFGFEDEAIFRGLITETKNALPKEMQGEFARAAKEVRTIDELAKVLNRMLANYGDTLDYNYMVLDYGGKDSIWLRMKPKDRANFDAIVDMCLKRKVTVDSVFANLMGDVPESAYKGEKVDIPENVSVPTEETLYNEL